MLGGNARARATAAGEGPQHVLDRHVSGHAVVRRNSSPAIEAVAQIEVARRDDVGRDSGDIESAEQARIDADVFQLLALAGDARERGCQRLGAFVRQAAQHNHTASTADVVEHLTKRRRGHGGAGEGDEAGRFAHAVDRHLAAVGNHRVEIEGRGQIGFRTGASFTGIPLAVGLRIRCAVCGNLCQLLGAFSRAGGKGVGFGRALLGAGPDGFEVETRIVRLSGSARDSTQA